MQSRQHWEQVYTTKSENSVSWFQEHACQSIELVTRTDASKDASIIDVGGGASTLVDDLLAEGYRQITVLDLSEAALAASRARLGEPASGVSWLAGDITKLKLPRHAYDVWHDRAVFHFLIRREEREAYVNAVLRAVKPGGHVIVATFAEDGPEKCSGLPVMRYSADGLMQSSAPPSPCCSRSAKNITRPPALFRSSFTACAGRKRIDRRRNPARGNGSQSRRLQSMAFAVAEPSGTLTVSLQVTASMPGQQASSKLNITSV